MVPSVSQPGGKKSLSTKPHNSNANDTSSSRLVLRPYNRLHLAPPRKSAKLPTRSPGCLADHFDEMPFITGQC